MVEEVLFRVLFVAVYALFVGLRVYYRGKTIGRKSEKDYTSFDAPMIVLSIAILGYLSLVILYILVPNMINWAHMDVPLVIRWIGVGLALTGVWLTFLAHHTLGRKYSARQEIQREHLLVTTGVYQRVRHPMYTGFNLLSLGLSVVSSNLLMMGFAVLLALPFPWIARKEEDMLLEYFGDRYREYLKTTGRFFPPLRMRNHKEPAL
ncbi:MAG: methyltransferase [Candidatus Ranarchaeia archaeon]